MAYIILLINILFLAIAYEIPQSIEGDHIYENVQVLYLLISMVILFEEFAETNAYFIIIAVAIFYNIKYHPKYQKL